MTETPLHIGTEDTSPFQEEIVLDNYFATENTEKILHSIHQAIADGVRIIVLSGDEGSGKTMLCHKLDRAPEKTCKTVFFPRTVDSFEDVVRIVALGLGLDPHVRGDARTVDEVLEDISALLISDSEPVLLVFDEAENIYLATLERIRKMLDRLSEEGGHIHVLFSGRPAFLENCQQLSICDFQNNEEYHIQVEALSENETTDYLLHSSAQLIDVDEDVIFTSEVVHNIYKIGAGNFRMTNILAEEAVQKNGDNTSFMVLLENVKDEVVEAGNDNGFVSLIKEYVQQYRAYLPHAVGGVGVILLVLLFLFMSKGEKLATQQPETDVVAEVKKSPATQPEPGQELEIMVVPEQNSLASERVVDMTTSSVTSQETVEIEDDVVKNTAVVEEKPVERIPEVEIDIEQQTEFSLPDTEPDNNENEIVKETTQAGPPVLVATKVVRKRKEPVEIVELLRVDSTKKRPGKLPKTTQVTIKEQALKQKQHNEVREVVSSGVQSAVEELYKKRLIAGTSWYNNKKNDKYTVQLMVLTSGNAEGNLKKMLREDRYRQEAGNFYIFKKLSTSDTLFVFYGEYDTIAQARLAQNSLPQFLRKHKPYAISVKGAMAKVRR